MSGSNGQIAADDIPTPVYKPGPKALREILHYLPIPIMLMMPRDENDPGDTALIFANQAASEEHNAPITWMPPGTIRQLFPELLDDNETISIPKAVLRVWRTKVPEEILTRHRGKEFVVYLYSICAGVVCIYKMTGAQ